MEVSRTFDVSAPREVVRTYLADFSNTVEWDPPTVKCVRRDAGEPRVGSTWDNTTKMGRSTTELVYELTELTDTGLVFRGENGSVVAEDHITFVETGPGRTRITFRRRIAAGAPHHRHADHGGQAAAPPQPPGDLPPAPATAPSRFATPRPSSLCYKHGQGDVCVCSWGK